MNAWRLVLVVSQPLTDAKPYKYIKGVTSDGKEHKVQVPSPLYGSVAPRKVGDLVVCKGVISPHEAQSGDVREYLTLSKIDYLGEAEQWKRRS